MTAEREWRNIKSTECQMCISGNMPHLQMTILIIVSNFGLNHQVDYYRLKLSATSKTKTNFPSEGQLYRSSELVRPATPLTSVTFFTKRVYNTRARLIYGSHGHVIRTSSRWMF